MRTRRCADFRSSGAMMWDVRNAVMDASSAAGEAGSRMPVRGILYSDSRLGFSSGGGEVTLRSILSSPTPVAMTGRPSEPRHMRRRQMALTASSMTTTRHLVLSPARFASISRSNCV